jgi:murein DD-endopeptidase MepM/ murein hydrolase activator NlpD
MLEAAERENLAQISISEQIQEGISLNPGAKLQGAILADGFTPVLTEKRYVSSDGRLWAWQPAERVAGDLPRRIYCCEVIANGSVSYGDVFWFTSDGETGSPAADGAVWAPMGTLAERQAYAAGEAGPHGLPGLWSDANPYGSNYLLRGEQAFHTGGDFNLNSPSWNLDAGAPVYCVADGDVVYAGRYNEAWGNLVVTRHAVRGGFYARYAHLAEVLVKTGDVVDLGQQIGTVGGADVGLSPHLHFDISRTDVLETKPGDWPGSDWRRLQENYVDPVAFLRGVA